MPSVSQEQHDFWERVMYGDYDYARPKVSKAVAKDFLEADKAQNLWQPVYKGSPKIEKLTYKEREQYVIFRNKAAEATKWVNETNYKHLKEALEEETNIIYIAKCGVYVIGELWVKVEEDHLYISLINASQDKKAPPCGKLLMDKAVELAKENKRMAIELTVHQDNKEAIAFYKRFGFTVMKTYQTRLRMQYNLTPVKETAIYNQW